MTNHYCINLEHKIFVQKECIRRHADNSKGYRCINTNLTTHKYLVLRHGSVERTFVFSVQDQGDQP